MHVSSTLAAEPSTRPNPNLNNSTGTADREVVDEAFGGGCRAASRQTASPVVCPRPSSLRRRRRASCGWSSAARMAASRASTNSRCTGRTPPTNLALASRGAVPARRPLLAGYAIHAVAHLNDGLYGNDHSWIAATAGEEWAEIELPAAGTGRARGHLARSERAVHRPADPGGGGAPLVRRANLADGGDSSTRAASQLRRPMPTLTFPMAELPEPTWAGAVTYAFLRERDTWSRMDAKDYLSPLVNDRPAVPGGPPYWGRLARLAPLGARARPVRGDDRAAGGAGAGRQPRSEPNSPSCAGRRRTRRQRLRTRSTWPRGRPSASSSSAIRGSRRSSACSSPSATRSSPRTTTASIWIRCSYPAEGSACCMSRATPTDD